jgi:pimeloyl-ACP methyl ester carboxylesterase
MSDSFVVAGVKIHYLTQGQGQPVVLIHGMQASAQLNWNLPGIVAELAKDHWVVALDLPGHGQSDKPADEKAYGKQMTEDVLLLMENLKIKQAHIVGYSLGGMVALKFLAEHQDRALSGTLGGMGWFREGSALARFWDRLPPREGGRTPTELIHSVGELAISKDELLKIKTPMKVIVGDRDPVERLYVAPLRETRSDWPVVQIADAGHVDCVAKPQFRDELAAWIRQNSKPNTK